MRIRNIKYSLVLLGISGAFVACSKDDENVEPLADHGRMTIEAQASYTPVADRGNAQLAAPIIELSRFLVNFKEIGLEFDEVIGDDNIYDSEDEIELRGPFEFDLLSPIPVPLAEFTVPNGRLEEIEFEFDKSPNPDSEIYNQSMRMDGTIDGTPFVFWHDFEDEIELEFDEDANSAVISGDLNQILINFDLNEVFNPATGVDLSLAVDGNGNGVIEIGPRDEDGNNAMAELIKRAIKNQIELLEDLND